MTPHAGDSVPAVDRSRSIPDAPDLAVAPAVSPEATTGVIHNIDGAPMFRLAEATTPEPMTEERLAVIRSRFSGYRVEWAPEVIELLNEVDRLRASSPSRDSGALATPEVEAELRATYEAMGVTRGGLACIRQFAEKCATLERDAARMREAIHAVSSDIAFFLTGGIVSEDLWRGHFAALRAALAPSGEATTPPETSE